MNSPTTLMEKQTHLRVHILPALGGLRLAGVSNEVLTDFFGTMRDRGYGKKGRRATSTAVKAVQRGKSGRGGGRTGGSQGRD